MISKSEIIFYEEILCVTIKIRGVDDNRSE